MAPPSDAPSGDIRLGVFYEFSKKELVLRFESSTYARAYQAKNPEGRIYNDRTREVCLPICDSMRTLRSSEPYGMVIIFKSKDDRRNWLNQSVLGEDLNTSDGDYGVRFKRAWSRKELEKKLDTAQNPRQSLGPPKDKEDGHSRPGSRQGTDHPAKPVAPGYTAVDSSPSATRRL